MSTTVYRGADAVPAGFGPTIVTIGNFDGVHCGHRLVIGTVVARARELGIRSALVTFDPHPAAVLRPGNAPRMLTALPEKLRLLCELGLDAVVVLPFTEALQHTSARDFAVTVLRNRLHASEVHEGENFRFGYQAEADIDGLTTLGQELGFKVCTYQPLVLDGAPVSSSRIRSLVAAGNMTAARHLLGRPFTVCSTPASGRGYGTRYAVPTINLAPVDTLLPANGVYVTHFTAGVEQFNGVTNVGVRPTFGEDSFAVETYLFNLHPIALDETTPLRLTFLHRLRDERRWPSPEALKAQIHRDVGRANRYLALQSLLASKAAQPPRPL